MNSDMMEVTNEDRTAKLAIKARTALLTAAGKDWEKARVGAQQAGKLEIQILNLCRSAGIKLQEAVCHEQVKFEFFRAASDLLPRSMTFHAVKFCIHMARTFEKPIATLDEARSARQIMFEAFGESRAPKRLEQHGHELNPWNEFVAGASSFTALFKSLGMDAMEDWSRDKLTTFIRETQPVAEAHERAKGLVAG